MRNIAILAAAALLYGCGTAGTTKLDVAPAGFTAFELRDERVPGDRISSKSSEVHGEVTRLGDDAVAPSGPQLLKAWLGNRLGERLAGKIILLTEFQVQVLDPKVSINEQGFSNAMASTPGAGLLAGALARMLIGGIESAKSAKSVSVRISGRVEGRDFTARGSGSFSGRVSSENINSVIAEALDGAATDVDRAMKEAVNPPQAPSGGEKPPPGAG